MGFESGPLLSTLRAMQAFGSGSRSLQEIDAGERLINHRRPIGVGACSIRGAARGEGTDDARGEIAVGKAASNWPLDLVGDHLRDFEKDRHICVTELDDVEERLLLPGITDRGRIVDPVVRHRSQPDAGARSNREAQRNDSESLRHGGD